MNILKFSASWCTPCQKLKEIFQELDLTHHHLDEFDVDNEDDMEVASRYRVRGVPTVILIDDNGNEITRFSGVKSKKEIEELLSVDV